jgi:hypothetical protein
VPEKNHPSGPHHPPEDRPPSHGHPPHEHPQPDPGAPARVVTIQPAENILTLNPTDTLDETITVTISKGGPIANVTLKPSPSIAPFIASIDPAGGYGPLPAEREHVLKFRVKFKGIPCKDEVQIVTGTIDVVIDRVVATAKRVRITVPPCKAAEFVYAVQFVCGTVPECGCACTPVRPGRYATEINIHNYSGTSVRIRKRVIPVVFAGAVTGREPATAGPKAVDAITLPPHSATMDDCCRLTELLLGAPVGASHNIGILEITASADVAVTAVYTSSGPDGGGVDIDVQQIEARR